MNLYIFLMKRVF
jgi:hypothetical protein